MCSMRSMRATMGTTIDGGKRGRRLITTFSMQQQGEDLVVDHVCYGVNLDSGTTLVHRAWTNTAGGLFQ